MRHNVRAVSACVCVFGSVVRGRLLGGGWCAYVLECACLVRVKWICIRNCLPLMCDDGTKYRRKTNNNITYTHDGNIVPMSERCSLVYVRGQVDEALDAVSFANVYLQRFFSMPLYHI